jgi:VanZ family protein
MFFRYNLFGIVWAVIILFLTLTPGEEMPLTAVWDFLNFDKAAHFVVFAVLSFMLIVGFTKQYTYLNIRFNATKIALAACFIYGLLIELGQSLIPGRGVEYGDILANSIGALIGYGVFYVIYKL